MCRLRTFDVWKESHLVKEGRTHDGRCLFAGIYSTVRPTVVSLFQYLFQSFTLKFSRFTLDGGLVGMQGTLRSGRDWLRLQ
jgi:hypothetical protein